MRCVKVDVPKENYVTRPALILDPLDRLIYQALVDQMSKKLIGDMSSFAYGWRLSRKSPESGNYLNNSNEWDRYRERLVAFAKHFPYGLTTDVVSCFASISIDTLMEDLHSVQKPNKVIERLEDFQRARGLLKRYETTSRASLKSSRYRRSCCPSSHIDCPNGCQTMLVSSFGRLPSKPSTHLSSGLLPMRGSPAESDEAILESGSVSSRNPTSY